MLLLLLLLLFRIHLVVVHVQPWSWVCRQQVRKLLLIIHLISPYYYQYIVEKLGQENIENHQYGEEMDAHTTVRELMTDWLICGGVVVSWLEYLPLDWAVRIRAQARDIVLCSWARHFTLTVPLYTQMYEWIPANLMLGGNPAMN